MQLFVIIFFFIYFLSLIFYLFGIYKNKEEILNNFYPNISVILCDHQARDLLACVDSAAIISNGKVVAQGTPTNLIRNIEAKNAYFGESFKIS